MDSFKFKTPDQIKLKVTEAAAGPEPADLVNESPPITQPAQTTEPSKAEAPVQQAATALATPVAEMVRADTPDDLLDIIANPHANEDEWVSACNQLDKHNRKVERDAKRGKHLGQRAWGALAALVVSAGIGAAASS